MHRDSSSSTRPGSQRRWSGTTGALLAVSALSPVCRTKQRHTAHQHETEGRIYYPFHPRCGEAVRILRRFAFRDVEVVIIRQPDGSDIRLPAWMTHESASQYSLREKPEFPLDILRSLRVEIDTLLRFLQSDSRMEKGENDKPIRELRAQPVRTGRTPRCAGARANDGAGSAARSTPARNRKSAGKRGDR